MRGRIMFDEQIRRRFGIPVPVEVRYDEFTDDILANRLVKAAVFRLGRQQLRSARALGELGRNSSNAGQCLACLLSSCGRSGGNQAGQAELSLR